jgi:ABC-type transport system substrate-binding protein
VTRAVPRTGLVALLLAAACSTAPGAAFRAPVAGAHRGGILHVAISAPGSVDPGDDYEPAGDLVVRTMCDALLTLDPRDGSVRPGLAESWVVADGGSKLVLRLRNGLRFSDGSPLTAADVAYSLSRVASADFASASADTLRLVAGFPQVHGDVPTDSDTARRRLAGVTTSDKRTVEITLSRPYADFLRLLASPVTAPVSRRAAEANPEQFSRSPVCAGPYRLAAPYAPGARTLRLVRSRAYTPADSGLTGGGAAYADEVVFDIAPTAGRVDVRAALPTESTAVASVPGPQVEYVGLPTGTAPFDRPDVRRALALALSRTELVRRVFPGTREAATGFLPPTTGASLACDALPAGGDVPRALALLQAAHVDLRGTPIPLVFNDELRNRALVAEVARQWHAALGLDVRPTPLTYVAFLARGRSAAGFAAPFRFSWSAGDVDGYLTPLFATDAVGRDNLSRFSDSALDEALRRRAWRAVDPADRRLAYRRILDQVCTQLPMIPLTVGLQRYVISPGVASASGRFLDAASGLPLLRELFLR